MRVQISSLNETNLKGLATSKPCNCNNFGIPSLVEELRWQAEGDFKAIFSCNEMMKKTICLQAGLCLLHNNVLSSFLWHNSTSLSSCFSTVYTVVNLLFKVPIFRLPSVISFLAWHLPCVMSSDPLLLAKIATPHKDLTPITITISLHFQHSKKSFILRRPHASKSPFCTKKPLKFAKFQMIHFCADFRHCGQGFFLLGTMDKTNLHSFQLEIQLSPALLSVFEERL